jgi:hypothetical protein
VALATVRFSVNQLHYRDPALAERFEQEITEAAAALDAGAILQCRILVVEGNAALVRIQFERPGWVKGFPPVPIGAAPGAVRFLAEDLLRTSLASGTH